MSKYLHVKPSLNLSFNEEEWNAPEIVEEINCLAHAWDRKDLGHVWIQDVMGISYVKYLFSTDSERLSMLEKHPAFTRIRKHEIAPKTAHIFAMKTNGLHALRFNSKTGIYSEKPLNLPARQWDDDGNALLDLEKANLGGCHEFIYFKIEDDGFQAKPYFPKDKHRKHFHTLSQRDIAARDAYYANLALNA